MFISGLVAFLVGVGILFGVALLITIIDIVWMVSCMGTGKPRQAEQQNDGSISSFSLRLHSQSPEHSRCL